jgi:hypothetical protein
MAQKLDIAFWSYDRTRLLADRSVKIEGAYIAVHCARIVPEIFEAMIRRRAVSDPRRRCEGSSGKPTAHGSSLASDTALAEAR